MKAYSASSILQSRRQTSMFTVCGLSEQRLCLGKAIFYVTG